MINIIFITASVILLGSLVAFYFSIIKPVQNEKCLKYEEQERYRKRILHDQDSQIYPEPPQETKGRNYGKNL